MAIHPRNGRYKERILTAPYEICLERARYYTESYRRTEGEHPALRAAKAFAHTLRRMSIYVLEEERIVGNRCSKVVGVPLPVERGDVNTILDLEMEHLTRRPQQPFRISLAEQRELRETILPYWRGKTLRDRKTKLWRDRGLIVYPSLAPLDLARRWRALDVARLREVVSGPRVSLRYVLRGLQEAAANNLGLVANSFDVQGHLVLGHKTILRYGFAGVKRQAQRRLARAKRAGDAEGMAFLQAVILSCDAIRDFAHRFAAEATRLAAATTDPARRREWRRLATMCRRVPFQPPRDFREAVQTIWFTQVGALIAHGMGGIFAVGRLDRHLQPFYRRDRRAGRIDADAARALLEELFIKCSYNLLLLPHLGKQTGSELGADSNALTVGGVDASGRSAVNDVSYLLLEAFANVRSLGNSFAIRLAENNPRRFWRAAVAAYRETSGAALFGDETTVAALRHCGYSAADARDYAVIGCVEPTGDGDTFGCTSGNDLSLVAALEMTLGNGRLRILGKRWGPATGDPRRFRTFAELMAAFKQQVSFLIGTVAEAVDLKDQAYQELLPCPYVSATLVGCVESARDMTHGGARHNFGSISARGLGTAVNSLAAIKHFVFDRRTISMRRLLAALDRNFAGDEILRAQLQRQAPKYGRDDEDADHLAGEVVDYFCREVARRRTIRGGPFRPGFFSYGMHVFEGLLLGATPDGRRAGEPVSNSFSPANGSETRGPTAMLRSVARIDQRQISNGCALNLKLVPSLFAGEERLDKMVALFRTYFAMGGMEVQPNVVTTATMRAAQQKPEDYRDLVVRVSGYSAFFTDLGRPLQDELISRTEFADR